MKSEVDQDGFSSAIQARCCLRPLPCLDLDNTRTPCSTPFGVYEVGTSLGRSVILPTIGAQRLSASMRLAQPPPQTLGFPVFQSIKIKHLQKSLHGSTILDGLVALYQLQTHCTKMFTRIQVSSGLSKSDFARNFLRSAIGLNLPISCTPRDP